MLEQWELSLAVPCTSVELTPFLKGNMRWFSSTTFAATCAHDQAIVSGLLSKSQRNRIMFFWVSQWYCHFRIILISVTAWFLCLNLFICNIQLAIFSFRVYLFSQIRLQSFFVCKCSVQGFQLAKLDRGNFLFAIALLVSLGLLNLCRSSKFTPFSNFLPKII